MPDSRVTASSREVIITISCAGLDESKMAQLDTHLREEVFTAVDELGDLLRARLAGSAVISIDDTKSRVEQLDLDIF